MDSRILLFVQDYVNQLSSHRPVDVPLVKKKFIRETKKIIDFLSIFNFFFHIFYFSAFFNGTVVWKEGVRKESVSELRKIWNNGNEGMLLNHVREGSVGNFRQVFGDLLEGI